jgi:DNA-binding LacI/PurR family transcriptional regulator
VRVAVCARNSAAEAYDAAVDLLSAPDAPDAIAAMSDEQALGGLRAAVHLGRRVPEDVAVSGWDDTNSAPSAGLTTIVQSLRDHGSTCGRLTPQPDARPPGREHRMEAGAAHIHPLTGLTASHRRHPRREAP